MAQCVACGAELGPPVRAPHTVYVKTLYRIVSQDDCRHHIIRATVAAGLITEVKPGAGPLLTAPRRVSTTEGDSPSRSVTSPDATRGQPKETAVRQLSR